VTVGSFVKVVWG